jgi:NACalpha-BTF3-like transcription factor
MKILTAKIKGDITKIKREPTKIIDIINTMTDTPYNKDILIIMSQTNVTREIAEKVYEECEEDLVNAIMYTVE